MLKSEWLFMLPTNIRGCTCTNNDLQIPTLYKPK